MKKLMLAAPFILAGLSLAACGTKDTPVASPSRTAPAPSVTSTTAPGATSTTTPAASTTASSSPPAAAGGQGGGNAVNRLAGVDWAKFVAKCPLAEQKMLVRKVYTADVTGDGVPDSLVSDACSTAATHNNNTVEVFDGASSPSAPRRLATLMVEDRLSIPWVLSLKTSGTTVTIKAGGYTDRAPLACPDLYITYTYNFVGGTAHRQSRETAKAADCIRITD